MKTYYDVIRKFVEKMAPYIDEEEFVLFRKTIATTVKCAADAKVNIALTNYIIRYKSPPTRIPSGFYIG